MMKKLLIPFLILLLAPSIALGAIALDSSSTFSSGTGSPSFTFTHTVNSNTNGLLLCNFTQASTITGVTYNSATMTAGGGSSSGTGVNDGWYYLKAPSTGANSVVVSYSPNTNAQGFTCFSFTGVDQTTPIDASTTLSGLANGTSLSNTITTITANDWVVNFMHQYADTSTIVPGGAQVNRTSSTDAAFPVSWEGDTQPAASIATYTATGTWSGVSGARLQDLVAIRQAAVATSSAKVVCKFKFEICR